MLCILTSERVLHPPFAGPNFLRHFSIFFRQKWEKGRKSAKIIKKNCIKGVCQGSGTSGDTLYLWLTSKRWSTPGENVFLYFNAQKMVFTSERHVKHPFAGQKHSIFVWPSHWELSWWIIIKEFLSSYISLIIYKSVHI